MQQAEVDQLLADLKSSDVEVATRAGWRLTNLSPALYTPELIEKVVDGLEDATLVTSISIKRVLEKVPDLAKPALLKALSTTNTIKLNEVLSILIDYDELDEKTIAEMVQTILNIEDMGIMADFSRQLLESRHKPTALKFFLDSLSDVDGDENLAEKAVFLLQFGLPGNDAEEILAEFLYSPNPEIRHRVIKSFILRPNDQLTNKASVEAALIQLLDDSDSAVQGYAITGVSSRGLVTPQIFKKFENFLSHYNPIVAANAAETIAKHPEFADATTVERLLDVFSNPSNMPILRKAAAEALGKLGPKARNALPILQQNFNEASTELQIWIAAALMLLKPGFQAELEFFSRILQNPVFYEDTLLALESVGQLAKPLAKQIRPLIFISSSNYDYSFISNRAIRILGRIAPELLVDLVGGDNETMAQNVLHNLDAASQEQLVRLVDSLARSGNTAQKAGERLKNQTLYQL